jgi:hypothetical protein
MGVVVVVCSGRCLSYCLLRRSAAFTLCALLLWGLAGPAFADLGDCGQPSSTGPTPVATDALFTLGAAVGSQTCELCVCDLNNDGSIAATDALIDLAAAVGQMVSLDCPSCGPTSCYESEVPTCGGFCDEGETCAPDPEAPDECECLNACEIGPAPTCGGSCESEDPESVCGSVTITPAGGDPIETCACLPPEVNFCENASAPACDGVCTPNSVCEAESTGPCRCVPLEVQPECGQAEAPACLGTCADTPEGSTICENGVDGCVCVPFVGQMETCFDAEAPMCGGVCAFGETCATDFDGCECLAPCEIGMAPSCGGDCLDDGETCIVTTIMVAGQSKDFCECRPVEQ